MRLNTWKHFRRQEKSKFSNLTRGSDKNVQSDRGLVINEADQSLPPLSKDHQTPKKTRSLHLALRPGGLATSWSKLLTRFESKCEQYFALVHFVCMRARPNWFTCYFFFWFMKFCTLKALIVSTVHVRLHCLSITSFQPMNNCNYTTTLEKHTRFMFINTSAKNRPLTC